jgi:energy-coupling factor transport system permease protein
VKPPIVLGSYVPGTDAVHRADPRVKLVLVGLFVVVVFVSRSWIALALSALTVVLLARAGGIPRGWLARSISPLLPLLLLTVLLNSTSATQASAAPLAHVGPVSIWMAGLLRGAYLASRLAVLIGGTSLLALVTTPRGLADALAFYARPLEVLRVPVDDLAMMMTIALRFMPTLAEELTGIVRARLARGADFSGSLLRRARMWSTVLVPLFIGLFRHADALAVAMEARGYRSGRHPRLHPLVARPADMAIAAGGVCWLVLLVVLGVVAS